MGTQVIIRLAADLQKRYSGESGFSERNLRYINQFAKEYPDFPFWQVPLAKLKNEQESSNWQVEFANLESDAEIVQILLAQNRIFRVHTSSNYKFN